MKHHDPRRPIGKCKGCCLNARLRCLAGLLPADQWRRRCRHYNDETLLDQPPVGICAEAAQPSKAQRQAHAIASATVPHYNGVLDPGKMAGRRRRVAGSARP